MSQYKGDGDVRDDGIDSLDDMMMMKTTMTTTTNFMQFNGVMSN
jgi:hypothetical protein